MTLEKLQVIIEAYTKPYRDELEKVKKQTTATTSHVDRQTSKMASSFKKIAAVVAMALSITAIVAFGKSCIDLGSQLAEVDNVIQQAVPSMSKEIDAFAKNAIEQFGMSEISAKRYTGVFASMARGFGYAEESAAVMSTTLTGLVADVASFYDTSQSEAFTKLKSVFTGETESLKDLGVVMTQSALDAYALANGYGKTVKSMSEAEKVALRYAFVQEKLRFAQGDFARNSNSWANQVRILSEQFNALKATIGQGLINAFTPVIQVINTILAKLQTLASYFKAFTIALFGSAGSGGGSVSETMDSAAGVSGTVADNMGKAAGAAKKLKEYTLGIDELNVLNPDDGDGGGSGGDAGGGGVPDFGNFSGELFSDVTVNPKVEEAARKLKEMLDAIKVAAEPTKEALKRLWDEGLAKLGTFVWTGLKDFWNEFLVPLGKWALGTGFPMFIDAINNFLLVIDWPTINEALRNFWRALEPFAEKVGEGLLKFFHDLLDIGGRFISVVVPGGLNGIATALDTIDPERAEQIGYALGVIAASLAALTVVGSVATGVDKLGKSIRAFPGFKTLAGLFGSGGILVSIQNLVKGMGGPGTASFDVIAVWLMEGINDASIKLLPEWVNKFVGSILAGIVGGFLAGSAVPLLGNIAGAIIGGIIGALNGIRAIPESILKTIEKKIFNFDYASKLFNDASNFFADAFSTANFLEFGANIIAGIGAGMTGGFALLLEPIGDLLEWVWEAICNVFGIHSPAETMKPLGKNILLGIVEGFRNTFDEWTKALEDWYSNHIAPWFTAQKWSELYKTIKEQMKKTWDETTGTWGSDISNWWSESVSPWFTIKKWADLYETIKTQLKQKWNDTSADWRTGLTNWWAVDVSPWFTLQKWLDLYDSVKSSLKTKWDETVGVWGSDISNWWSESVSPWFTLEKWTSMMNKVPDAFREVFKGAVNAAKDQLNRLIDWLNEKLHISFDGLEIMGEEIIPAFDFQLFTIPRIPAFAAGGFPEDGLFFANHNELVGGFKGRTAVANNDQITEGIKLAVVEGMIEVMSRYSGNEENMIIETHVDMDGRTIIKQSDKVARRGGFNFRSPRTV